MHHYLRICLQSVLVLLFCESIISILQPSNAQSDELQALIPDALPECASICDGYSFQMIVSACPRTNSSDRSVVARCKCADKENMEWFAACIDRTCSDEVDVSVDDVLGRAYSTIEKNCVELGQDISLNRDEFFSQGGAQRRDSVTGTAVAPTPTVTTAEEPGNGNSSGPTRGTPPPTDATVGITSTAVGILPSATTLPADDSGLSRSDKVAIGVGLGVGIPTMMIALLTLVVTCRGRIPWLRLLRMWKPKLEAVAKSEHVGKYSTSKH